MQNSRSDRSTDTASKAIANQTGKVNGKSMPAIPALQKKGQEEELPVQAQLAVQLKGEAENSTQLNPSQLKAETPIQREKNNTGLPDNLKSGVEALSGHSLNDVKVHYNSAQPSQLNALAYAQRSDIHVAPGQEKHLPHEAWHVAQQKQGRVQPTMQMKQGVAVNDDAGLETEADVMGAKALQMKSVDTIAPLPVKAQNSHSGNSKTIQAYRSSKLLAANRAGVLYVPDTVDGTGTYHITRGGIVSGDEKHNKTTEPHRNFEYCAHLTWKQWNGVTLTAHANQAHMYYRETGDGVWQFLPAATTQNTAFKAAHTPEQYQAVVASSSEKIKNFPEFKVAPFVKDDEVEGFQKYLDGEDDGVDLEEKLAEYRARVIEEAEVLLQAASSIDVLKWNLTAFKERLRNSGITGLTLLTVTDEFLDNYGDDRGKVKERENLLKTINDLILALPGKKPKSGDLARVKATIEREIKTVNNLVTRLKAEMAEEPEEVDEEATTAVEWIRKLAKTLHCKPSELAFDRVDGRNVYYHFVGDDNNKENYAIDELED